MYDDCDGGEVAFSARKHNAQETDATISAINAMRTRDFSKMMGSGILVSLVDLSGNPITPEFCLPAEDMTKLAPVIAESLIAMLQRRRSLLNMEIASITKTIEGAK